MKLLSIVIPVYQEVENVPRLHAQLIAVADKLTLPVEFVIVDDGSQDGTWDRLVEAHRKDKRVRAIRLKRNFGQTPAMACGIDQARGDVIITMDGDLQNDPADIPRLLEKINEGYDVVCGWRHQRKDKMLSRKIPSMIANRLIGTVTGVRLHDYGCSLKAYRASSIKRTPLYAELHRFIPAMSTLTGASIIEIKVNHRARTFGKTKYNLSRTWRVALDMMTVSLLVKFSSKPLRLFGMGAMAAVLVGTICVARSWHWYVTPQDDIPQVLPGAAVLCFWLAGNLTVVGFLAELCLATVHQRPALLIAALIGGEDA